MSESQLSDLEPDERFFVAMWEWLRDNGVSALKGDPTRMLKGLKAQSPAVAKRGVKEAVNDLLEATDDFEGERLAAVDSFLAGRGAQTLTAQRLTRKRWIGKLLKRGRIENDEEFRLLSGKLGDVEDKTLSPNQRALAGGMLSRYEQKVP
jgi:hypothetical protein